VSGIRQRSAAAELRAAGALAVLRLVHEHPGVSRAEVARALTLRTGSASEIVGRLRDRRLLAEVAPGDTGRRGRPSGLLVPHPDGPVVLAAEIAHAGWRATAVELGGHPIAERRGRRARDPMQALREIRRALGDLHGLVGNRCAAVAVSVAGTVVGERLVEAATLRWRDLDLARVIPGSLGDVPFVAGNDATLAGLAEARRGVAAGVPVVVYLSVEVGIGGVLLVGGRPLLGALGEAGEFGHMPFGDPALRCPCGARGCWDLEVDGRALARALGRRTPADPRRFAERTLAAARSGATLEQSAVDGVAYALGRGTGAVVNALDPSLVVVGALAADMLALAPAKLRAGYEAALMRHRRADPPAVVPGAVAGASLVGAAEAAFDAILTPELLLDA
jgi:predicted NBD/HSP70 family sugar kinase